MSVTLIWLMYAMVFVSAMLAAQVAMRAGLLLKARISQRAHGGMSKADPDISPQARLQKMRRTNASPADSIFRRFQTYQDKLIHRSGLPIEGPKFYILTCATATGALCIMWNVKTNPMHLLAAAAAGVVLPYLGVRFLAKRSIHKAVAQLPDALDIIVRSLKAGHPVPVSMSMVGREMPEPLSKEFKIAADEISFGATPGVAVQRIADRLGHEDFDLFAAMIRLNERTGGNLADLLEANAKTIRGRFKMRMKIKAASAEGRMSALILNAAPIILYVFIRISSPEFYGEVEDNQVFRYGMMGIVAWMTLGNLVMRRMINFRI